MLKPLFPDARAEVTEDTGVAAVRSDIKIPSMKAIIEAKCTRRSMNLRKLTEEIGDKNVYVIVLQPVEL